MTDPSPRPWLARALRRDLPASFVVFLVAVPLSLGIALASLARVPAGQPVRVDLALTGLDHAGWEALDGWRHSHERGGGVVHMDGSRAMWGLEKENDAPAEPERELAHAAAGPEGKRR